MLLLLLRTPMPFACGIRAPIAGFFHPDLFFESIWVSRFNFEKPVKSVLAKIKICQLATVNLIV